LKNLIHKVTIAVLTINLFALPAANAGKAGQFCKSKQAMQVLKVKDKTLQCQLNGKRYRWKEIK
jgi:hypothetical protein